MHFTGRAILFNVVVSLIFVLRYLMTFLRNMGLAHKLPLDHSIYFHKVVGWLIFSLGWVHILCHLINFGEFRLSIQCFVQWMVPYCYNVIQKDCLIYVCYRYRLVNKAVCLARTY